LLADVRWTPLAAAKRNGVQPALEELAPKNRVLPHTPPDLRPGLGAQLRERVRANAERLQRVRKQGQDLTRLGLADKEAANQKLQASLQRTIKVRWKMFDGKRADKRACKSLHAAFLSLAAPWLHGKAAGACGSRRHPAGNAGIGSMFWACTSEVAGRKAEQHRCRTSSQQPRLRLHLALQLQEAVAAAEEVAGTARAAADGPPRHAALLEALPPDESSAAVDAIQNLAAAAAGMAAAVVAATAEAPPPRRRRPEEIEALLQQAAGGPLGGVERAASAPVVAAKGGEAQLHFANLCTFLLCNVAICDY